MEQLNDSVPEMLGTSLMWNVFKNHKMVSEQYIYL